MFAMSLRAVTFWGNVLFTVLTFGGIFLLVALEPGFLSVAPMIGCLLCGPYIVTAVIVLFTKTQLAQLVLLVHSLYYVALKCFAVLMIFAEVFGVIGNGRESAAPWLLIFLPFLFMGQSALFCLAAIITEVVLRCQDKNKEPEVP